MKAHGPHIRFELGLDNLMVEAYRRKSLRRALAIYRSIFGSEDDVIFIHRTSHCKSDPLMISSNGFLFFVKTIMEEIKKRKGHVTAKGTSSCPLTVHVLAPTSTVLEWGGLFV